jgi:hypothetical protein
VLSYDYWETDDREETSYIPIEDTGDDRDCLKRMLEKIADYFGESYDPFKRDNIEITFTMIGDECEDIEEGLPDISA